MSSAELEVNPRNWRVHPHRQSQALAEALRQIGIAGAITAYYSERNGGKLTLIDGHERVRHATEWPTLILDVTDEEADQLLATFDPIGDLAMMSPDALSSLLGDVRFGTTAIEDMLLTLTEQLAEMGEPGVAGPSTRGTRTLPEMELQPFEHYDYVVLLCRHSYDWRALCDVLGVDDNVQWTDPAGKAHRIGYGRVVDARRILELLLPSSDAAA